MLLCCCVVVCCCAVVLLWCCCCCGVGAGLNEADAQLCIGEMNRPVKSGWAPWMVDQQLAGYVTVYDTLTYATVKGAGHEVLLRYC